LGIGTRVPFGLPHRWLPGGGPLAGNGKPFRGARPRTAPNGSAARRQAARNRGWLLKAVIVPSLRSLWPQGRRGSNPRFRRAVADVLGHSQIGLTLDTYSHLMPGVREDAAEKMDALLRG
jgi:hypothetical protein